MAAVFAVRVAPTPSRPSRTSTTPRLADRDEAHPQLVWPGYRTSIVRIRDDLSDPERAPWFELTLAGEPVRLRQLAKRTGW